MLVPVAGHLPSAGLCTQDNCHHCQPGVTHCLPPPHLPPPFPPFNLHALALHRPQPPPLPPWHAPAPPTVQADAHVLIVEAVYIVAVLQLRCVGAAGDGGEADVAHVLLPLHGRKHVAQAAEAVAEHAVVLADEAEGRRAELKAALHC